MPTGQTATIEHAGAWALGRFAEPDGREFPALVTHDRVLDLSERAEVGRPADTAALLAVWDEVLPRLDALAASQEDRRPLAGLRVLAPVDPRQVFQAGANYRTHVIDIAAAHHDGSDGRTVEQVRADAAAQMDDRLAHEPYVFQGLPSAVCGAYDDVVLPHDGQQPDWELELAAVIARPTRRVTPGEALDAIAGWVVVNDLTLRERIFRKDLPELGADWLAAKNSPTFLPTGPVLVPRRAVPDPGDLRITLRLNGEVMQDESTKDMIFDVARIVSRCSHVATLLPGDLVLTGSPAGNGMAHGRLLRPGDVMDSTITGLGAQSNRCVREETGGGADA
jgi:2,4-diketo-3-deoxy-L-fuconate hydrolase